jgi:hypothetical protein
MLVQALAAATRQLQAFAEAAQASQQTPVRIEAAVAGLTADDQTEADAIKRGQKPQQIEALRKALGL